MGFWASKRSADRSNSAPPVLSLHESAFESASKSAGAAIPPVFETASLLLQPALASAGRKSTPMPLYVSTTQFVTALVTTLGAAACMLHDIWHRPPLLTHAALLLVLVPLLLLARSAPLSATRERPLTFMAPLVFGLCLWFGPLMAALSAWTACWLYARFGAPTGSSRRRARAHVRWQGAHFALSSYAASAAMAFLAGRLFAAPAFGHVSSAFDLLALAALGAFVFVGCLALCYSVTHGKMLRDTENTPAGRAYLSRLTLVMTIGLLPIVLLAPLETIFGAGIGLPLLLLLLLAARLIRQSDEVSSLYRQLHASEAMGRASIHDPGVMDGAVLLQRFLALAQELVPAERSLVWILDQKSGELNPEIALPDKGPFARQTAMFGEGLIGHAAARMLPRLVVDAAKDPHRLPHEHLTGAWLLYPIVVHEQLLGVAQWTRPVSRPFTQEDIARLETLVPQAAIALENVYIRAQMHDLASTDGLTGLWNHRRMFDLLREEIRRATRYHRALCVLMMDVDSFKTFNDTYGHPQGDQLLKTVAGILQNSVRSVDHVGRYGGEEFIVILPETSKDDACRLAERIRSAIEEHACVMIEGRAICRTISIGVAAYPEDALSSSELIQRADEAMYRAKRAGKNRVLWA